MKNSNDTIGNRTRDIPACGAVPQPTAPTRAPRFSSEPSQLIFGRWHCAGVRRITLAYIKKTLAR